MSALKVYNDPPKNTQLKKDEIHMFKTLSLISRVAKTAHSWDYFEDYHPQC